MANQVVLTFAGETRDAEAAFDRVGGSARAMGAEVEASGSGFDRVGESADAAEGKAQGFSDTLTGVADIGAGTSEIMKGNLFEGFVTVGTGMADLAGGMASFLIPALSSAVTWLKATRVGQLATAAATKIWAAAQWIMNAALLANPITWVVIAVVALIAIIVLIAKRTDWFSKAWSASWAWIKRTASNVWDWLKGLPDKIRVAFAKVAGFISAPYRAAFNLIADAWNNTVGRLSFTFPSWIPGIGGNSISVPNLPRFHAGGIVPGVPGTPTVALLQAGERVTGTAGAARGGGDVVIRGDGSRLGDALVDLIAVAMRDRGGDPGALGIRAG